MAYRGGESSFFQGIHVRIHLRIEISISTRPETTEFDKKLHVQELTQIRPIEQVLVTSLCQDHVTN